MTKREHMFALHIHMLPNVNSRAVRPKIVRRDIQIARSSIR